MFPSYTFSSQGLVWSVVYNNRRLLMHNQPTTSPPASTPNNGFDANVVMVLSILLCAIVCSLAINFIVRCALRCSVFVSREPNQSDNNNNNNNNNNNDNPSATTLANTGVKKAALKTFPTISYEPDLNLPGLDTECAICISEFAAGERVRLLPKCNHGFHVRCIDKWLNSHSSCPTCRHCLIETCQKIVGCTQATESSQETIIINMVSLAREDMIRN